MESMILQSKNQLPVQPRQMVSRPRLVSYLENELTRYRLTVISAPAGYGKTTLLAEWTRTTRMTVAWLSVGEEENDLESFLRYTLAAWEKVQPEIADTPLGILLGSQVPDIPKVLTAFINATLQVQNHLVFVLDDYHLIENQAVHKAFDHILDHIAAPVHFILTSRVTPPLPLSKYRIRNQLLEIGTKTLSFTPEESQKFLRSSMNLTLTEPQVLALHDQTEGWVAGIQLAALALRRGQRAPDGTPLVRGNQRFIVDYFRESVFEGLPEAVRAFLLQTCILERFCGSLCDAVTGNENSQTMLETIENERLFLIPLDDHREWFRYHALFKEFLRSELAQYEPAKEASLHRKAARWLSDHGFNEPALSHAIASQDGALTAQIAEPYVHQMVLSGKLNKLQHWLDSIPQDWHTEYPVFGIAEASILAFTGEFEVSAHRLEKVERNLQAHERSDLPWQLAKLAALRCGIACFENDLERAEVLADQALKDLPENDHTYRAIIFHALGDSYRRTGRWQRARQCYLEVLGFSNDPAYHVRSVHVYGALADLDLLQGHLRDAAANWQRALKEIPGQKAVGSLPLPVIGWVFIRMSEILYEWNQLSETRTQVLRGLKHAELGGDEQAVIAGYLLQAKLMLAEGEVEQAAAHLEDSRLLVARKRLPQWISQFERSQIDLWLAQGRSWKLTNYLDEGMGESDFLDKPGKPTDLLIIARVLIHEKDESALEDLLRRLDNHLQIAEAEGRIGRMIEILAIRALAYVNLGDRIEAMIALEQALRLAEPEGYVRLFVDLGLQMGYLLKEALVRKIIPDYVTRLLSAYNLDADQPDSGQTGLPQPLTPREGDVLALIASGLTNREIAETLIISPETVKKHAGNIYAKLGVSNRTQAVARAREVDMLD